MSMLLLLGWGLNMVVELDIGIGKADAQKVEVKQSDPTEEAWSVLV